ncbi:hypothetical protein D3C76_1843490 [compost metagenome]
MRQDALVGDFGGGHRLLDNLRRPHSPFRQLHKGNTPVSQMIPLDFPVADMSPVYALRTQVLAAYSLLPELP